MSSQLSITFTKLANLKVKEIIKDSNVKLRVHIIGGGCSGFKYEFSFDENKKQDDFIFKYDDFSLLVDGLSFQYLIGSEIDYADNIEGTYFFIKNPNAKNTCGCGSSFSI